MFSHFPTTYSSLLVGLSFVLLFACQPSEGEADAELSYPKLQQSGIAQHMEVLSSDAFGGRMPCTYGDTLATQYIYKELERLQLLPSDPALALQEVGLVTVESEMEDQITIQGKDQQLILEKLEDFVVHSERMQDEISIENAELVFCGYGIQSKVENWDDYAGMDMSDKIAVVMVNDPGYGGEDSTLFQGNTMTIGGRWDRKYDVADAVGAAGIIIIHETSSAGYPWFVIKSSWTGPQQGLAGIDRSNDCGMKGWISLEKANALFQLAGMELGASLRSARQRGFKPQPMGLTMSTTIKNTFSSCTSQNVIGIIPGEKHPEEYVVYTTHWDHLGIGQVVDGDSIYNGALDNASGVSSLLAMAEAMSTATQKPARSVVFLFVTAEEQGLLGSEYYAENPVYPLDKTVANINLDGVNPAGRMKDLTITGPGYSEMDEWAKKYAELTGRYVMAEQEPEKGYFFRSDQFNFAKKGVPVLYAEGGYDHEEKGKEYAMQFKKDYVAQRYHSAKDEFDPATWNFDGMMQDAQLMSDLGWGLANSRDWPKWYPQSEFQRPNDLKD